MVKYDPVTSQIYQPYNCGLTVFYNNIKTYFEIIDNFYVIVNVKIILPGA